MPHQELERTLKQLENTYARFIERTRLGRKLELPKIVRICLVMRGACHDNQVQECLTRFQLVCERLTRSHLPLGIDENDDLMAGLGALRQMRERLLYDSHAVPVFQERRVSSRRRSGTDQLRSI
jgi:hypothetical protein